MQTWFIRSTRGENPPETSHKLVKFRYEKEYVGINQTQRATWLEAEVQEGNVETLIILPWVKHPGPLGLDKDE